MGPMYNRIHLGRRDSLVSPPRNHFLAKYVFRVPKIGLWGNCVGVGSTFGPGELFGAKNGPEKDGFVEE